MQVILVALRPWSFLIGSTIAKYRSAERAVNVKTETPMETSLINSENLQTNSPYGQLSTVYTVEVKGTQNRMTRRSPTAKLTIYLPPREFVQIDLINGHVHTAKYPSHVRSQSQRGFLYSSTHFHTFKPYAYNTTQFYSIMYSHIYHA